MGVELHSELISQFVEEELYEIAMEEVPKLLLDEIIQEELEDIVWNQKEVLPFAEEEFGILDRVLGRGGNRQEVVNNKFNIEITRDGISCLRPGEWLNDEGIAQSLVHSILSRGSRQSFQSLTHNWKQLSTFTLR